MNDIVFINPPYERISPGNNHVKHVINRSPSLGLLSLAAQARRDGYNPSIIESDLHNLSPEAVANIVLDQKPKFVGITLFTVGVFNAAIIAEIVKNRAPDIIIIVGGPHISSMGYETMQKFGSFDVAVLNEGELILKQLLSSLENNTPLDKVEGIIYKDNENSLKSTSPSPIIKDLDSLPMPAWDLLEAFPESYLPAIFDYPKAPVATYSASRGCPFKCEFCDTSTFGQKTRYNSPERVYEIMKHLRETYGIKHLQFVDDLFISNNDRVLKLCNLLIAGKLDMTWSCTARVDTVKKETLKIMKEAGCWEISFGLESGSDAMLKLMKKSITSKMSREAVELVREADIRVKGLFMLGFPGENKESIEITKEFIKSLPLTSMNLSKFTPYPGSPIYKKLYNTSIRTEDWERLNGMNFVYKAEGFTEEELDKEYSDIIKTFYKRVKMLIYYTKMLIGNPLNMKRILTFMFARFFRHSF